MTRPVTLSVLAGAVLALAGCDQQAPKTVVIEKDTTIVKHEPTVVIREDRDHGGDHMGPPSDQPHGPPPARRDDRRY